jgi:PAS domain S-box-containing protein
MSDLQIQLSESPAETPSRGHAVQFYDADSSLIDSLVQHFAAGLIAGDTMVIIATAEHRQALAQALEERGIDLASARNVQRFVELDSLETLRKLLVEGWPDDARFAEVIGGLVEQAQALNPGRRLLLYGEMVAHLWAEGKHEATVRLEELWNGLAERIPFFLLCGYPLDAFNRSEHSSRFFNICGEHTHVNAGESYQSQPGEQPRRRTVARLQTRTRAMDNEIRLSQERLLLLQDASQAGTWEMDPFSGTFSFSSAAAKLLGIKSRRLLPDSEFLNLIHYSADRDAVTAALRHLQRGRRNLAAGFRLMNDDGARILEIRGKTAYNAGSPIVLGVLIDVTDRAAARL